MRILNVGGGSKDIALPDIYMGWEHVLLDVHPGPGVDLVMDARNLAGQAVVEGLDRMFDAVWCSHNLEHYPSKDVQLVLDGFRLALRPGGHVHIRVPNFGRAIREIQGGVDLQAQAYTTPSGPVTLQDLIFGSPRGCAWEEDDLHIHRTGFTQESLSRALTLAGFNNVEVTEEYYELRAVAWASEPTDLARVITAPRSLFAPGTVMLGFAHNGSLRHEFHQSIMHMTAYEAANGNHLRGEVSAGGPYIPQNRTMICQQFLRSQAEWLWMVDNDVVFPADMLERLSEHADPVERPILSALYFTRLYDKWLPVWLEEVEGIGQVPVQLIEIGQVRELDSTGMGCILIHRTVLEKMAANSDDPWPWFGHDLLHNPSSGVMERSGEDVTFCSRARAMGFKVHGLAYPLVHLKTYPVDWRTFHDQFRLMDLDAGGGS